MIKVLHFIHGLNTGGAETLVKNYLLNFDRSKFDIVLLCMSHVKESPYEAELKMRGIRVIYVQDLLPFKTKSNNFKKLFNYFSKFLIIKQVIKEEKPNVLHTHLPINYLVKFARPAKKVLIFHTVHNEPTRLWPKNDFRRQKDFSAAKWLVRHCCMRFIVLHEEMRKEINKMFDVSDTIVLNNGIDMAGFKNAKSRNRMLKELKIPQDAFVVGHVGRFSWQKNHQFLIDVFGEIKKRRKNAFLLMIGDGPDKDMIIQKLERQGLSNCCSILSNRNDIADLMSSMDVFVFPSIYEGLGIALIEAQESCLPCFISNAVPSHADISNLVTRLPLDDGVKKWADVISAYKKPKEITVDDEDWDIKKITKRLERIYIDALLEKKNGQK